MVSDLHGVVAKYSVNPIKNEKKRRVGGDEYWNI